MIEKEELMWLKKEIDTCENVDEVRDMQISLNDLYITLSEAFTPRIKKLIYFYVKFKLGHFLKQELLIIDKQ